MKRRATTLVYAALAAALVAGCGRDVVYLDDSTSILDDAESLDGDDGGGDLGVDATLDAGPDGGPDGGRDGGPDGGRDGGPDGGRDGGLDGGRDGGFDGGRDGGFDGGRDGGFDGGRDGGFDGGRDGGRDGGFDGGPDGGFDGGPDGGFDGGPDGGRDGGPDAGRDAGPDAGRDAGPDAGRDAGPDAGGDSGPDGGEPCFGVDCTALDGPCQVGICEPALGGCIAIPAPDGVVCQDEVMCQFNGVCQGGLCLGGTAIPPGDSCADPLLVTVRTGTITLSGSTACALPDQNASCISTGGRDLVHALDLDAERWIILSTLPPASGGFDTALHVQQGACGGMPSTLCADTSGSNFTELDHIYGAGQHFVWIDGSSAAQAGDYTLQMVVDPHDNCGRPRPLAVPAPGAPVRVGGTTRGAGDDFQAMCAGGQRSPDHVYSLVVTQTVRLLFETLGPSFDTALSIWPGPCLPGTPAMPIACDDDSGPGTLSRIDVTLQPGSYFVVVDGFGLRAQGVYQLQVSQATQTVGFVFPDVGDARLTQLGNTFSRDGDFVEGVRPLALPAVTSMAMVLNVQNNMSCGTLNLQAMLNGLPIGMFSISPGVPVVMQAFNFMPIGGPNVAIRYEVLNDLPMGCGNVDFPEGISSVSLSP